MRYIIVLILGKVYARIENFQHRRRLLLFLLAFVFGFTEHQRKTVFLS